MSNLFSVAQELDHERASTARLLDRLPVERMAWRPHPKSMTLGQLALHVATIPTTLTRVLADSGAEATSLLDHPHAGDPDGIRRALEDATETAKRFTDGLGLQELASSWSILHNGKAALTVPKVVALRLLMLNHWYHHRGQLTVYLRLLDVPLPPVYGASADENPFA